MQSYLRLTLQSTIYSTFWNKRILFQMNFFVTYRRRISLMQVVKELSSVQSVALTKDANSVYPIWHWLMRMHSMHSQSDSSSMRKSFLISYRPRLRMKFPLISPKLNVSLRFWWRLIEIWLQHMWDFSSIQIPKNNLTLQCNNLIPTEGRGLAPLFYFVNFS